MMVPGTKKRLTVGILTLALALAGCGSDGESADETADTTTSTQATETTAAIETTTTTAEVTTTEAPPDELTEVTVRGDFFLTVYHAPYFIAQEKGWYEEEGLSVEFREGQGSTTTVQQVVAGEDDFGFAAGEAVIRLAGEGAPVKMVANIFDDSGLCLMVRADSGIEEPSDIEGRTYAAAATSSTGTLFPAFAAAAGIDLDSVEYLAVDFRSVLTGFVEGNFDSVGAIAWGEPITAEQDFGIENVCMRWSDYGVTVAGHGLITSDRTIEERPEVVAGFVRATLRAFEYLYDNPQEGLDIMRELAPAEAVANLPSDATNIPKLEVQASVLNRTDGRLGYMSDELFEQSVQVLTEYGGMENPPAADDTFTNQFVPES